MAKLMTNGSHVPSTNGMNGTKQSCNGPKYLKNPHLEHDNDDILFHLKLSKKNHNFKEMFGDVKFVCIGGTARRMKECAKYILNELKLNSSSDLQDLTAEGHRYSMYKAGCVLCVNHGMGYPSIMILLHEVIKLLHYAEVQDPIIIRIGTSGGLTTPLGTVVISDSALNDFCEPYFRVPILGKVVKQIAAVNQDVVCELKNLSEKYLNFPVITGTTMSNEHLYESTASKSAAVSYGSEEERQEYFERILAENVVNLDMESIPLFALTHQIGIKSAVVNVIVNSILTENMVTPSSEELMDWEKRPIRVVCEFIKSHLRRCENGKQ